MVGHGSSVSVVLSSSSLESRDESWSVCVRKYARPLLAVIKILLADINKKDR